MEAHSEPAEQPSAGAPAPQSDIRTTAGQDSNLAAVLAGFAFTAVILVMQQTEGAGGPISSTLVGQATSSFLVAFFGCLVSATLYAVVAGDVTLGARARGTFFFTSVSAFVGGSHLFFGLCCLSAAYLPDQVYLSRWVLILGSVFGTAHLLNVEVGSTKYHDPTPRTPRELALVAAPSLGVLAIAAMLSLTQAAGAARLSPTLYPYVVGYSLLCVAFSSVWALVVNGREAGYRLPSWLTAGWTFAAALLFSILILLT